jgi:hypothetical protein
VFRPVTDASELNTHLLYDIEQLADSGVVCSSNQSLCNMSGHPQGGQYDNTYGHEGQGYYQDDQQGYYDNNNNNAAPNTNSQHYDQHGQEAYYDDQQ